MTLIRIVTLSDTHNSGDLITVPDGDVLVHTGDHTFKGTEKQVKQALRWLESLPHKYKLFIAGNHDWFFDPSAPKRFRDWSLWKYYTVPQMLAKFPTLTYLQDSSVEIEGLKFYGSPWQPNYFDWAFQFRPGLAGLHDAENKWAEIPDDVDVLLTHTPPEGILDRAYDSQFKKGCPLLRRRLNYLPNLKLHVFGHIHEGFGRADYDDEDGNRLTFVNAACLDFTYKHANPPIVVDLERKGN